MTSAGPHRRLGIGFAALALLTLAACERRDPVAESASPPRIDHAVEAARVPAKPSWPFLDEAQTAPSASAVDSGLLVTSDELTRRNYYVVFDASGSMRDARCSGDSNKLEVAKQALLRFAGRLPGDANVGLHVFDGNGIRQLMPLGLLDRSLLQQQVDSIRSGGGTPLAETTAQAYEVLTAQARKQLGYGEYHLVIVTDGEATGEDPRNVVNRIVSESPVLVNTIGFCLNEAHSLNQPGRTLYKAADNPAALEQTLADVLAEAPSFDLKRFDAGK